MYSVEQVAKLLELHPKTVRRFIREGRVKARKIGREWRISQSELAAYTHAELVVPTGAPPSEVPLAERVHVSAVIEVEEGGSEEVSRISNSLIAMLNCKDPAWGAARYDLIYHPEVRKARFVLYGTSPFLRNVLELVEVAIQQGRGA